MSFHPLCRPFLHQIRWSLHQFYPRKKSLEMPYKKFLSNAAPQDAIATAPSLKLLYASTNDAATAAAPIKAALMLVLPAAEYGLPE